jgi:undecaprenyl-diphosphatase
VVLYLALKKEIRSIVFVLSAVIGGGILVQILKFLFARPRPEIVPQLVSEVTMSFPSGHSAMSAVVYLSLAVLISRIENSRKTRVFLISSALIISFIVGLSRVYLGVHYPTDVLAGWMIGLFWALLCWFIASIIENKS